MTELKIVVKLVDKARFGMANRLGSKSTIGTEIGGIIVERTCGKFAPIAIHRLTLGGSKSASEKIMMTIDQLVAIPCPKCGKPIGKACDRWEGYPGVCPERARAAEKRGSTVHVPGCDCGFCKAGFTKL
jgi:hypothetical protein